MTMTSVYQQQWHAWREARERALATPHGWLSLTAFHWLPDTPSTLPGLPGLFSVAAGHAVLSATADDGYALAGGEDHRPVPVDGVIRAQVAEATSLQWLTLDRVVIELALRGGRYAIRTRDPRAVTLTSFAGVPTFIVDESWLLDGVFEPFAVPERIAVNSARGDLWQQITTVGTITVMLHGDGYPLIATAGGAGTLNIAFHDLTNGDETAGWRAVATTAPDAQGHVRVDFNRAVNFPYAFTDSGTCPAPPIGNALPFPVTAGELAPSAPKPAAGQ